MKRIDVMVDIETLGIEPNSTIFQISAACFDLASGDILNVDGEDFIFDSCADISLQKKIDVDSSTLKWWVTKYPTMMQELMLKEGSPSPEDLLRSFGHWLKSLSNFTNSNNIHLWGNGIGFDNNMLKTQMDSLKDCEYPIRYYSERDYRTVIDIAAFTLGKDRREFNEELNNEYMKTHVFSPHNAMDDVYIQIYKMSKAMKLLSGGVK